MLSYSKFFPASVNLFVRFCGKASDIEGAAIGAAYVTVIPLGPDCREK